MHLTWEKPRAKVMVEDPIDHCRLCAQQAWRATWYR